MKVKAFYINGCEVPTTISLLEVNGVDVTDSYLKDRTITTSTIVSCRDSEGFSTIKVEQGEIKI